MQLLEEQAAAEEEQEAAADWKDAEVEHAKNVELVARWVQARRAKDYRTADRYRAELRAKGVEPEQLEAEAKAELAQLLREEEEYGAAEADDEEQEREGNLELTARWVQECIGRTHKPLCTLTGLCGPGGRVTMLGHRRHRCVNVAAVCAAAQEKRAHSHQVLRTHALARRNPR